MTKGKSIEWEKLQREKNGWESKYIQFYGKVEKHINRHSGYKMRRRGRRQKCCGHDFFVGFAEEVYMWEWVLMRWYFFEKTSVLDEISLKRWRLILLVAMIWKKKRERDNKKYNSDYSKSLYFLKFFF